MITIDPLRNMNRSALATSLVLLVSSAVILAALGFQYIGGYIPCTLCYYERFAYYFAIPATVVILMGHRLNLPLVVRGLLLAIMIAFLLNALLGIYHAGAEWKFWPGPTFCGATTSLSTQAGNLLDSLSNIKIVRCDQAGGRFLGISFAGYNVLSSLFLAFVACWGYRNAALPSSSRQNTGT